MNKNLKFIWEMAKIILIALAIVVPIRYFLFQPFFIRGISMEPNFENGDYLIIDEISYRFREPVRGEVIVFKYPQNPSQKFIKRIIGLPGETVEVKDGNVSIYNEEGSKVLDESSYLISETTGSIRTTLKDDEYFVMGDNRDFSFDSRRFGILPKKEIIGRAILRAWPIASLGIFSAPSY